MDREKVIHYLGVLELECGATLQDVRTAYKELCLIWHPDKHPARVTNRTTRKLQLLNEAYQWLTQHADVWDESRPVPARQSGRVPETVGTKNQWWRHLDHEWKQIFRKALGLIHSPNDRDVERILTLEELDCSNTAIHSLAPIRQLQNLRKLECDNTQIDDLGPLRHLRNLEELDCWSTRVKSLAPLQDLTNLRRLNCNETLIDNLDPLQNLINLEQLSCTGTNIRSLAPLQNLQNLRNLSCGETPIYSLKPLKNLLNLCTLYCSHTLIESIAPLRELPNLQALYCLETKVGLYELGRFRIEFPQCKVTY